MPSKKGLKLKAAPKRLNLNYKVHKILGESGASNGFLIFDA